LNNIEDLSLKESLKNNGSEFDMQLNNKSNLTPTPLNSTILNLIYLSNPNFIYLYSNYSTPFIFSSSSLVIPLLPQQFNFILNSSSLNLLNANRDNNQVYNATWIRDQMCLPNNNYLLKGSIYLNDYLCNQLNDSQLVDLFILVSAQINFTYVIEKMANSIGQNLTSFNEFNSVLLNLNSIQQVS
jgi:hypothetical protein